MGNADKTRRTSWKAFRSFSSKNSVPWICIGKINFFYFSTFSKSIVEEISTRDAISREGSRLLARCLVGPRCVRRCRGRACASTCAIAAASGYAAAPALGRRVAPGKRARGRPCTTLPPPMRPAARPTAEITCYHPGSKVGRVLSPLSLSLSLFSLFLERSDVSYFCATSFPLSKELEKLELYSLRQQQQEKKKSRMDLSPKYHRCDCYYYHYYYS